MRAERYQAENGRFYKPFCPYQDLAWFAFSQLDVVIDKSHLKRVSSVCILSVERHN